MKLKDIPFSLFVGDMPTYKYTDELKAENSQKFIPFIKDSKVRGYLTYLSQLV